MEKQDQIWKALSDGTRRKILQILRDGKKTTTEIVDSFPELTRFNVMKHLDVLRSASLVETEKDGRKRFNSLNSMPLERVLEEWVGNIEIPENSSPVEINIEKKPKRISQTKNRADFGWKRYD